MESSKTLRAHFDCTFANCFTQGLGELIYLLWVPSKVKLFSFCRHLPEKVKDDQQLKNMSGQWFYEAKAKRHRDKIHGTDIIRASMRKKRLQVAGELMWLVHGEPAFVWEGGGGRWKVSESLLKSAEEHHVIVHFS